MAYEKQNFEPGQVLTAAMLNHMEEGIANLSMESVADASVPSYVRTEAERVAALVQSRQGANTLTFIAASDFHYSTKVSNAAQQTESLTHMGQAMRIIRQKAHIDFTVSLGDMVWDAGESVDEALAAMRFVSECLYGGHNGTAHFRTRGNHDNLYSHATGLSDAQIFANIGAWNSGAEYDATNRIGGYCYRDFDGVKIRVICLNSSESGGCQFSSAQVAWLTNALDLSQKGEGWRSIIVSHHPLDWGKDGGESPINAISNASGLICCVHGHIHNFKVDTISGTDVTRIAIPNACFGRENEYTTAYGITYGEDTKYTKTAGTASDTSFCVITIDPDAEKIYADHYGAGYDRVIGFDGSNTGGGESGGDEGDDDTGGDSVNYTNLVPTSQAMDSTSPYNGTGYKDGYYLSSDSPFENVDSATVLTGYMPYTVAATGVPKSIYIKGATWSEISHCRLYLFDSTKSTIVGARISGNGTGNAAMATSYTMETLGTNYYKLTPVAAASGLWNMISVAASAADAEYFRVSLAGTGANLIITLDEPIE